MADQAQGTLTVKVPGYPTPIQFADWTHDRLFHTVQMAAGNTLEVQAFVGGTGSPIPGGTRPLSLVDTNIPKSGDNGLPEGWEALVYAIELQMVREIETTVVGANITLGDFGTGAPPSQYSRPPHVGGGDPAVANGGMLFDFLRKTFVRFEVNAKRKSEGPAEKYPQGSGISVFGTTTDLEIANNGIPSPRDAAAFVLPIWLRANISYVCRLLPQAAIGDLTPVDWASFGGTPGYAFDVRVTLRGLIKRPVA
jgi:hypothetical protein